MTKSRSLSPAPDVLPIYLFVCLFIFFACHATVVAVAVVTGFVLKRLFASVANVCLEVGPSAVKHHRFFLEFFTAILSYLESRIETVDRSSPEVGDASQLEIVMSPFFVTMVYATRKRKVERSLRGTQDYVSTLRIVDT